MFQGNNTLLLNTATMMKAVQMWLDSQFLPGNSPQVTGVKTDSNELFRVSLAEPAAGLDGKPLRGVRDEFIH